MKPVYLEIAVRVGNNLRAARKRAGLKQVDVEERVGVAYRHYQDIEAGLVDVKISTLARLAQAFRTSPSELLKEPRV